MAPASYRSRAGSLRPNEMQRGSKRYRRRNARPVRSDSSSSAWSVAIFSAAARPCRSISTRARRPSVSGKGVGLHRRAHAHQVPVPVGAVDAAHRRPHLVLAGPSGGEGRALARVGPIPRVGDHVLQRVWRICKEVIAAGLPSLLDLADLRADRDERVAETVELLLGFAFG